MIKQEIVTFQGGLDLVTTPISIRAGSCIAAQNFESEVRGYKRFEGYERLDGQPKPSEATYSIISFDTGTASITEGDTLTGASSGATATVLADAAIEGGSYVGGDAAGTVSIYNQSGSFVENEALQISAATAANMSGLPVDEGAATDEENNTLRQSAIAKRRAVIAAVPGSGPTRGVFTYKGDVYAVRDNVGATVGVMHKATASGWVEQSYGHTMSFDGGSVEFLEGDALTGSTSSATATVERVVLQDGSWDGSALGFLVLSGVTGVFQDGEAITSAGGAASAASTADAIALPPGGKYRVITHNFYGSSNLRRAYMANGEGYAHEWDGAVLAPIVTSVPTALDKPRFIGVVGAHLFLCYDGGSAQYSGTGLPLSWRALDGAGELGLGEDITGFKSATKTTAIITGRNKISYISGTSSADFLLEVVSEDSGAVSDTLEVVGQPLFLDDRGIRNMQAADTYGNWRIGTTTQLIEPLIRNKRSAGRVPVGTLRVRSRDIYRMFYDDGTGVSIYFGRSRPECMPLTLGFEPSVFFSGDDADGYELLLAGDNDGFVYQMDAGTSFDGGIVEAFVRTSFMHLGTPTVTKRFAGAILELDSQSFSANVGVSAEFQYGDPSTSPMSEVTEEVFGAGGFWNSAEWNRFQWSSRTQAYFPIDINGIGSNVSLVFMSDASDETPHTLASMTINYSNRRQLRRTA